MTTLAIGCTGFPVAPEEYATQLSFVEIEETFHEGPDLERVKTDLERVAGDLTIALVASKVLTHQRKDPVFKTGATDVPDHAATGHFTRSRWTDEAWDRTDALVRSIRAKLVVLRTPSTFRKSPANALALENFIAHAERPGLEIAWDHGGVWPDADVAAICERLGLIPVADAAAKTLPDGPVYLRYRGGATGRTALSESALERLAGQLRGKEAFVTFANQSRWEDARRLAKAI